MILANIEHVLGYTLDRSTVHHRTNTTTRDKRQFTLSLTSTHNLVTKLEHPEETAHHSSTMQPHTAMQCYILDCILT